MTPGRERGRNVYSLIERIPSRTQKTTVAKLAGPVELHHGWYSLQVHAQPTLNVDRVQVSVEVPEGWMIDKAPKMDMVFARRANANVSLDKTTTFRVHLAPDDSVAEPLGSARQRYVNRSARRTIKPVRIFRLEPALPSRLDRFPDLARRPPHPCSSARCSFTVA